MTGWLLSSSVLKPHPYTHFSDRRYGLELEYLKNYVNIANKTNFLVRLLSRGDLWDLAIMGEMGAHTAHKTTVGRIENC